MKLIIFLATNPLIELLINLDMDKTSVEKFTNEVKIKFHSFDFELQMQLL